LVQVDQIQVSYVGRVARIARSRSDFRKREDESMRLCLLSIMATLLAVSLITPARADAPASTAKLGKKIDNVTFKDEAGKTHALYDLKGKKATVIVFLSFECPVSTSYSQPLSDMAKEFGKHGVAFVGLTTNEDETPTQIAKHARDFAVPFPVYLDR